ncbi:MAG: twin-arginine translocase subunit TatC [Prevotellaceae bacterium]|jgi:sec-independent protein translocase protein TatC|nr:twin-arginine translocase subunit TatC [Prevotellaceae bacterium]
MESNKPEVIEQNIIVNPPKPQGPKKPDISEKEMSFWDHLDELRGTLFRGAIGIFVAMIVVFLNKGLVFDTIILAPKSSDFIVYRFLCYLGNKLSFAALCPDSFNIELININLAGQFFMHISTSFWLGLVLAFPWVIYQLWLFIRPALYEHERSHSTRAFLFGSLLFFLGVAVAYFMVFPLTIRFLGTYQVSAEGLVPNQISLTSYISTFTTLTLAMGIVFEMPVLLHILSRLGIVTKKFLRKYRRHAIVVIMILAAIITPTADPFTMIAVAIPILGLYEFSIWICKS